MTNHVSRIPLTDQVYERIMQSIFEQQYAPGQELRINQIARDLGVSATPVREALSRLVTARMVELTSFKGFRVAGDMGAEDAVLQAPSDEPRDKAPLSPSQSAGLGLDLPL